MRVYATVEELETFAGSAPDNAVALIREASLLVEEATMLDVYATDADGYPTDQRVKQAFMEATCAQATLWSSAGLDPTKGATGQTPAITSQSVPGGSVSYQQPATMAELGSAATTLCDSAYLILRQAGLCRRNVGFLR